MAPKKTDRLPEDFLFGTEGCGGEGRKSSRAFEPRKELSQHIPTGLEGRRYRKMMTEHRLPIAEKLCGRARKAVETEREWVSPPGSSRSAEECELIVAWATGCRSASTATG